MKTSEFKITSAKDGTVLRGITWHADNPRAILNLVHGLGEHCGRYVPLASALAKAGITTTAIDLRGHGTSEGKRGVAKSLDDLHSDIQELLNFSQSKSPDLPQFLMGHSMGGGLVLSYTLKTTRLNLAGVIAQAPLIEFAQALPWPIVTVMRLLRKVAPNMAIKSQIEGERISSLPEEQSLYENDPLNHGSLGIGLGLDLFNSGKALAQNAARYSYPALITHGDQDQLTSFSASRDFASLAPNARFIAYENARHEIHNEFCRAQVHADLIEWIEQRLSA